MSLVNDMLRDLDQRRKDSSGSAAAVSLTPAPEIRNEVAKKPYLIYLLVALIVGAGTVAWFWMQQDGGTTTRQLDIAPRLVDQSSPEASPALPVETEVQEPSANNLVAEADLPASSPDNDEIAIDEIDPPINQMNEAEQQPAIAQVESAQQQAETESSEPSSENNVVTATEAIQVELATSRDESPTQNTSSPVEDTAVATVDLNEVAQQDVKDAAELTPEERDLQAVQEALRLISNNNNTGAYAVLEQQMLDNRYAHQTRETYAKLLMSQGDLGSAYEITEAGLGLSPNHAGFKKVKARILISQGEIDEAVKLLLSRAPEVSQDQEYHDILATAQLASRDYEGALISYSGLVQHDQSQGKWWYGFAASQDSLGNQNAAVQGYSQAMRLANLSANLRRRSQERLSQLSQ